MISDQPRIGGVDVSLGCEMAKWVRINRYFNRISHDYGFAARANALGATIRRWAGLSVDDPRYDILETDAAIWEELSEIERRRRLAGFQYNNSPEQQGETLDQRAKRLNLTAVCLSGGGIRSAAFCLGVLQSLASKGLLNEFDYLSTVSGGGFIGGWLQTLIKESPSIDDAQTQLAANGAPPLHRLRAFTNYLTPVTGPFSADVWAGIVLYLRNLILNWMVFAPLFLLVALAPIFYRTLIAVLSDRGIGDTLCPMIMLVAVTIATVSLAGSVWQACELLPSHKTAEPAFARSNAIIMRILAPSLAWAFIAPMVIASSGMPEAVIPATYAFALILGYFVALLAHDDRSEEGLGLYSRNKYRWAAATVCSTGLLVLAIKLIQPGGLLHELAKLPSPTHPWLVNRETALATFGPLWFVGTHVFHTTFYVGFRKEAVHADLDREWLARLNGGVLMIGAAWTAFALSCLVLPVLFTFATKEGSWDTLTLAGAGAGTSVIGALGAWLGKKLASRLETATVSGPVWIRLLPPVLAGVFAIGVFVFASSILQPVLGNLAVSWSQPSTDPSAPWHVVIAFQLLCAAGLCVLVLWFGRVNVNRFSMHAIYRNRLARAFIGSARPQRSPDPYTGFDAGDNPAFDEYRNAESKQRLFPVINMTLNVTSGKNAAWAERKAESFCATPLTVGAGMLRHPAQRLDDGQPLGAFARTKVYAGKESRGDTKGNDLGPRLASLLTISGAAVSPNWGYHSSPLTAFLMTLFNVRLGAWLPNPGIATPDELRLAKPKNSVFALLCEMIGITTDSSQAVYLSDGGHFENLGLYEMLRRRCQRIVVIDAGQDGECEFFDLGNAIRKARIDLNVEVAVPDIHIVSRKVLEDHKAGSAAALAIAVGCIAYPGGGKGKLLYLKPTFLAELPADVLAYGRSHKTFPHDNTAHQWFSESQFESYRTLGRWHFDQLAADSLENLFAAARTAVARVSATKRAHRGTRKSYFV